MKLIPATVNITDSKYRLVTERKLRRNPFREIYVNSYDSSLHIFSHFAI